MSTYENALRSLWTGRCSVYVRRADSVNPLNGRNEPVEIETIHDEPCRLSFSSITSAEESGQAALIRQTVKLFVSKNAEVQPGSKIVVTQNGKTATYARSGEPAIYRSHQEIALVPFKGWA